MFNEIKLLITCGLPTIVSQELLLSQSLFRPTFAMPVFSSTMLNNQLPDLDIKLWEFPGTVASGRERKTW